MSKIKRILVTGMSSNLGGVEKFIINYCKEIVGDDLKADFLISDDKCALESEVEQIGVKVLKLTEQHAKHPFRFKKQFREFVKEKKIEGKYLNNSILKNIKALDIIKKLFSHWIVPHFWARFFVMFFAIIL